MNKTLKAGICGAFLLLGAHTAFAADAEDFVDDASAKGIAEIEAGRLAEQKSQSADVKAYAAMMIKDHTAANKKLKGIATDKKLEVASDAMLMDKAKAMILDIRDDSFDKSYANNQVKAHEATIEIFKKEINEGKDAELKAFAKETLPKLEAHLTGAKKLAAAHGGDAK